MAHAKLRNSGILPTGTTVVTRANKKNKITAAHTALERVQRLPADGRA